MGEDCPVPGSVTRHATSLEADQCNGRFAAWLTLVPSGGGE